MRHFKTVFIIGITLLLWSTFSCRKDFETYTSNGNLSFSVDTLFLDTVFNNLSTTTYLLKVYNTSKKDITVPKIKLANNNSKYRINVDGNSGTELDDVLILKKDSLFVFVEATVDATDSNTEMLYIDKLLFDPNGNQQEVTLVTLVQEANLLFSNSGTDFELSTQTFTNNIPYVIYGNAVVPENGSLTIDAGTRVHFSENASLTISSGATLNINGTLKDSVVFKGDKLSYIFNQVPGQWQGIHIKNNVQASINYLQVLNPTTGIKITDNTKPIHIQNTEIYNAANYAIYTQNANITAANLVIGQTGRSGLFLQGGNYTFNHCTFANYWSKSFRTQENVILSNFYTTEGTPTTIPLQSANFTNCIVAGTKLTEILFNKSIDEPTFNFTFKNCMLNLKTGEDLYNTNNTNHYTNVILNKTLDFRNTRNNDLRIGLKNEGINSADTNIANSIPLDIVGTDRTTNPDIGAYQHIDFETLAPKDKE